MKYCVGYMFNDNGKRVSLILKAHPDWQKGKWNGVGGKLEKVPIISSPVTPVGQVYHDGNDWKLAPNEQWETPFAAMVREFKEETGVEYYDWTLFAVTHGPSEYDKDNWEVYYFKAFSSDAQNNIRWITDEIPSVFPVDDLPPNLVAHNSWLIPMAFNASNKVFHITEELK